MNRGLVVSISFLHNFDKLGDILRLLSQSFKFGYTIPVDIRVFSFLLSRFKLLIMCTVTYNLLVD